MCRHSGIRATASSSMTWRPRKPAPPVTTIRVSGDIATFMRVPLVDVGIDPSFPQSRGEVKEAPGLDRAPRMPARSAAMSTAIERAAALSFLFLVAALPWSIAPMSIGVVVCGALTLAALVAARRSSLGLHAGRLARARMAGGAHDRGGRVPGPGGQRGPHHEGTAPRGSFRSPPITAGTRSWPDAR